MNTEETVLQELLRELVGIRDTKCNTLQEVVFFNGVLAIIEAKYLSKEREQIQNAHLAGQNSAEDIDGEDEIQYYNSTYQKVLK